ncbi:hypothetical protein PYH37_006298 (plasmid) [Sinorhizobium numidicum]|uniref:Transposase n=1 Tax=Sinorhizobium numidicum TaxID=680248 RepID=A0ABY8D804_9HYPH|nr:hypothetical protein [Sinorhizobium numidicum]WEX79398.1 hypothetical protein PYH37_006298 [Sinorhizobium numidicum]WEX85645.1 hypothetical protein PYH38_006086 [Sinorhizobium numidicum]
MKEYAGIDVSLEYASVCVVDAEMSLRGILRGFGLKVGATTRRTYVGRASAR